MSSEFQIKDHVLVKYTGKEKNIVVPDGVTKIGNYAFGVFNWDTPPGITSITLPESVKEVGACAFANLKKLTSYTAPAGIRYEQDAFHDCRGLADENGFVIIDHIAMWYCGSAERVVIPDGVHTLEPELFRGRFHPASKKMTSVHLPDSLRKIGADAFACCPALEEVNLPEGLKEIGSQAFLDCGKLKDMPLPASLESIGAGAFCGCRAMADEQGFVIKGSTLYSYYGRESDVIVPEGIDTISKDAFSSTGVKTVRLPASLKTLDAAFTQCSMLTEIAIPEGVEELPNDAFRECIRLARVSLPTTLRRIGDRAFAGCEELTTAVLPDGVTELGSSAFKGCEKLESIVLPASLTAINENAFQHCSSLKQVELPPTVTVIDYDAFDHCTSLKKVKVADASRVDLHTTAFTNCPALGDENGFFIFGNILLKYLGEGDDVVVPEGIEVIAADTFREGWGGRHTSYRPIGSLHSIQLPASVKTIGAHAFSGCENLKEIQLPPALTAIEEGLFFDCPALKSLRIPASVKTIGTRAFHQCTALKSIEVDENNPSFASVDGVLFTKDKTELLYCPGARRRQYVVPDFVATIADQAFIDCTSMKKLVIPENVQSIGSELFFLTRSFYGYQLETIEISPKAGKKKLGSKLFPIDTANTPLVHPKLPLALIKETSTQLFLAMGYCLQPEKYEGEYAALYKKYVDGHEKAILKKAKTLRLTKVEQYFEAQKTSDESQPRAFKPDVSNKKLSEQAKVELLEETVQKGALEDVQLVLSTYKTFEMTARALAIAGRYRGLEFVKALAEAGATFAYEGSSTLQRKYKTHQDTAGGSYRSEYYLLLVPEKLDFSTPYWGNKYSYSPLCGIFDMEMLRDLENQTKPLPTQDRFEIAKYCWENQNLGVSMDEMLFWALSRNEIPFSDLLIAYGTNLNTTPPRYYYAYERTTYLEVITSGSASLYWNAYVEQLGKFPADDLLPVLERLNTLAQGAGKQLAVSQKLFSETPWNDQALIYLLQNADLSKINQKKALELAVSKGLIGALEQMAQMGWLAQAAKREKLIEFAQSANLEALAWLMDFKNRTVDVQAEAAKEEAKFMRELSEDPNSVTALKRLWSYKKLEDGTLVITSYKGEEEDVTVPAMIGKAKVTVISEEAFSAANWISRIKNREARKKIRSITIPEGIVELQSTLVDLDALEKVVLPDSLKKAVKPLAQGCDKLREINIPAGMRFAESRLGSKTSVLWDCKRLQDKNGFTVIGGVLYAYHGKHHTTYGYRSEQHTGELVIPEGVTRIAECVFDRMSMKNISFPQSLKVIGEHAFEECAFLESVEIPGTVEKIKAEAFKKCRALETIKVCDGVKAIGAGAFAAWAREVYIPASVTQLGKNIFGPYDEDTWSKVTGVCVHTQEGAPIVDYLAHYQNIHAVFDYDEAMKK